MNDESINPVQGTADFYNRQATAYQAASERHMARIRLNTIRNALRTIKPDLGGNGRIVDLGCGTGHSTEIIRSMFESIPITGIDCSAAEINIAVTRSRERNLDIEYQVGDLFHRRFVHKSVDLFVAVMSIHYFRHPDQLVRLLRRLSEELTDQGQLVAQIPNPDLPFPYRDYGVTHSLPDGRSHEVKEGDAYDVCLFSKPHRHWESDWGAPLVKFTNYFHSWRTFSHAFSAAGFFLREQSLTIPPDLLCPESGFIWEELVSAPLYRTLIATKIPVSSECD